MKVCCIFLVVFFSAHSLSAQRCLDFEPYTPFDETTLEDVPLLRVNLVFHIIQHSKKTPKNLTYGELGFLDSVMYYCNVFFRYLEQPTLKPTKDIPFFTDTRIRLNVKDIKFYQDSVDWKRFYYGPLINRQWPWQIDSISIEQNAFFIKTNQAKKLKALADSIQIIEGGFNNGMYHVLDTEWDTENKQTKVILKESFRNDFQLGKFTYFQKYDKNCYPDLWQKYTDSDSSAIHIFLTGSDVYNGAFGCGPSPYYLNFTNMSPPGTYPTAQLLAHEIGHCLGLFHTDRPQFDDLPKTDRFCSCSCNEEGVSNNIMGYNLCRRYLSPKQVGHIHRAYNTEPAKIKCRTECLYDASATTYVSGRKTWERGYVMPGDLVLKRGATLAVNCLLSMPEGSTIYLEKKSKLIVNGTIMNACGGNWNGVKTLNKHGKVKQKPVKPHQHGLLVVNPSGKIENVR
ncbi:MAG: hypothetical protein ACK4K0_06570 [Flavobacteriales bacterium]